MLKIFLYCFFLSPFAFSFKGLFQKTNKTLTLEKEWTVNMSDQKILNRALLHSSSPLLVGNLVIQGNGINGIQAHSQDKGRLIWKFPIQGGVFSSLTSFGEHIYFGASDGFFYSLHSQTGKLNWKFFTGSENLGPPLVHKDMVYWTAANQKLYALSLQGSLVWIYAGPPLTRNIIVRGRPRPTIYRDRIFVGFYDGSVVSLHKKSGQFKWRKFLFPQKPIISNLHKEGSCLFVPVYRAYLFCLNPKTGKEIWKVKGSHAFVSKGSYFYQWTQKELFALDKVSRKKIWSSPISSYPLFISFYKDFLIYGSLSEGKLFFLDKNSGKTLKTFVFGKGISSPVTINKKTGEVYFFSIQAQLHKIRFAHP